MDAWFCRSVPFDPVEGGAKGCWDIAPIDREIPELDPRVAPRRKCQHARQWTSQHGRNIGTDPAEPLEVCDCGLRDHEGVEEPTRRAKLLHHALANPFAKMSGINEPGTDRDCWN
jgi:hypothetical protein